jgi:hypothetical protein
VTGTELAAVAGPAIFNSNTNVSNSWIFFLKKIRNYGFSAFKQPRQRPGLSDRLQRWPAAVFP